MKKIFDIFTRGKGKKRKKEKKTKVFVDFREKNSLVFAGLYEKKHLDIEVKSLKVGDYVVGKTCIERKAAGDFVTSIINKRLVRQLEEIKQYKSYFLIIEGDLEEVMFKNKNALRGMILSIVLDHKVPLIYTRDEKETAEFIYLLSKRSKKDISLRENKRLLSKKEQIKYILEGFQGIGPKNAEKLLKKFGNLASIFSASSDELSEIIGKKAEVFKLLKEKY